MTNLRKLLTPLFALSLLAASTSIALAEDDDPDSGEWEFVLSPLFLWGVNLNGNATMGDITAPLELNFKDDILENLDSVFTVHFEARNDKWTFFGEFQHLSLKPGTTVSIGPISGEADVKFTNDMLELGVTYAFS